MMAEYAILVYEDESKWAEATPEWMQQVAKEHQQFAQDNGPSLRGGGQLLPTYTAKAVRVDDPGGRTVSPGPMVNTTPALSGYYVIEAPDLDAATEIAQQVPSKFGGVEVRALMAGQG
jgi:hypothetical protein